MQSALTFSGGRRSKWLVALFWLLVFLGLNAANIFDRYADAEKNRTVDYYPEKADSIQLLEKIDEFPAGGLARRHDRAERRAARGDGRERRRHARRGPRQGGGRGRPGGAPGGGHG